MDTNAELEILGEFPVYNLKKAASTHQLVIVFSRLNNTDYSYHCFQDITINIRVSYHLY